MDRQVIMCQRRVLRALTISGGAAAGVLFSLAATSYRFNWSLGGDKADGSMPTPSWGCAAERGYFYVNRTSEKLIFDVGDEGTFILSVPPDVERSFQRLFGLSASKEIWVTGNIYDPDARHEYHHQTVWVSLWLLGGMCAVLPLVQWSRGMFIRRADRLRDRCAVCRYCLHGNQSGICPECGASIPDAQRALLGINP
ncbi:MAG TPA: hypothetical protein VJZ71_01020 [Phycisphaerae bacterium]|nr:hypothetical protein [Phycisphaerae bacterium]